MKFNVAHTGYIVKCSKQSNKWRDWRKNPAVRHDQNRHTSRRWLYVSL